MGGKFRKSRNQYVEEPEAIPGRKAVQDAAESTLSFYQSCTKPTPDELKKSVLATGLGMAGVGFAGFFVKAISIPILHALGF